MKKRIVILATGGTISAGGEKGATTGYTGGKFDVNALISGIPNIGRLAELSGEQVLNVSSADITPDDWLLLADRIHTLAERDEINGFVITHGTDTLDETAYFLNLFVKTKKPVVITGAMRPATATSADGPLNLYQAVALAASSNSAGKGVMAVFADAVYGGRDVQKINNFRADAFSGRDFGCMGYIRNDDVYFINESIKRHTTDTEFDLSSVKRLPKVAVAYFHVGADPGILEYLSDQADGLVIAGAGGSVFSREWLETVSRISKKIPVVRSTRVASGITVYDAAVDQKGGTIYSVTLPPQKSKILLMAALTKTRSREEIQRIFEEY